MLLLFDTPKVPALDALVQPHTERAPCTMLQLHCDMLADRFEMQNQRSGIETRAEVLHSFALAIADLSGRFHGDESRLVRRNMQP
jgi:hypothetical protein